jgi:hypothetical protein
VYVGRYLAETGRRLELLTGGLDAGHLTDRLEGQEDAAWQGFRDGIERLTGYLAENHPDEYAAILAEDARRAAEDEEAIRTGSPVAPAGILAAHYGERLRVAHEKAKTGDNPNVATNDFVEACVACYRSVFDPSAVEAELAALREEHDRLVDRWGDLPTKRAKDTAAARLAALDARMGELGRF